MSPASPRVPGFRASGVSCGIKPDALDLALIASDVPAAVAGVFTQSTVVGAPVELSRERVRRGRARGVVVNSGCANVAMGARGLRDARAMSAFAARATGVEPDDVLVASTGVIGEPLPMAKIKRGVGLAAEALSPRGLRDAARAIMTTDTYPKLASRRVRVDGRDVTVAGIAKGSGMIEPNMATMLAYLLTDADVAPAQLRRVLRGAVGETFNRVTVDGEGSTSDTVLLFANGVAGNRCLRGDRSPGAKRFGEAVRDVSMELARHLARDGEGATKLVTVNVTGARNPKEADAAARRIANSMLVKTAVFGRDPNWGRILQTVGAGRIHIGLARAEVQLCGVTVFRRGAGTGSAARRRAERLLRRDEVEIDVALAAGRSKATIWTCDLTYEYVKINAEYTT
ncbi:MAG: bifunctional glutamate N-acetyltransferase/amino-acid acetyltransferase ArgJ [Myxococcales bacterium]|nr:bifunctional glutamate N-acetyltransferase/amino-acid acetyltransferase ArgJ [Myxococcales bacterium]